MEDINSVVTNERIAIKDNWTTWIVEIGDHHHPFHSTEVTIEYLNALSVASATILIILIVALIVRAQHSRSILLNKLTLKPMYTLLVFLCLLQIQVIFTFLVTSDGKVQIFLYRVVQGLKAVMFCLSVNIQLLEWSCLASMVRFQSWPCNRDRLLIVRCEFQAREKKITMVYVAIMAVYIALFCVAIV